MFGDVLNLLPVLALPMLVAITLHEAAHGFVAWRCGDPTAYMVGRVSLNPLRHIDPVGTVVLPLLLFFSSGGKFLFGYAKPVPVNVRLLRKPRRDMVIVAAAGPIANFVIAIVSALLLHAVVPLPVSAREFAAQNLMYSVSFNVMLGLFNLLPLPPLDGGRVAVGLLPRPLGMALARVESKGMLILIAVALVLPALGRSVGLDLNILGWILNPASYYVTHGILSLAGW
jgi:Zn-dependent protease